MKKVNDAPFTCCQKMQARIECAIPFLRMLILDYYDGPTRAITFCDVCERPYLAVMQEWNADRSIRSFSLTEVDAELANATTALFPETPRWPQWFPSQLISPTEELREKLDELDQNFDQLPAPRLLLGLSVSDGRPVKCEPLEKNCREN